MTEVLRTPLPSSIESSLSDLKKKMSSLEVENSMLVKELWQLKKSIAEKDADHEMVKDKVDTVYDQNKDIRQLLDTMREIYETSIDDLKSQIDELKLQVGPTSSQELDGDQIRVGSGSRIREHVKPKSNRPASIQDHLAFYLKTTKETHGFISEAEEFEMNEQAEENQNHEEPQEYMRSSPSEPHEIGKSPSDMLKMVSDAKGFSDLIAKTSEEIIPSSQFKLVINPSAENTSQRKLRITSESRNMASDSPSEYDDEDECTEDTSNMTIDELVRKSKTQHVAKQKKKELNVINPVRSEIVGKAEKLYFKDGYVKPERLFENFCITGVPREHAMKYISDKLKDPEFDMDVKEPSKFRGKVLFDFARINGLDRLQCVNELETSVSPRGFILTRHSGEVNGIIDKVVLKKARKYKKRSIVPVIPHHNDLTITKWENYVDSMNPHNKLYIISIIKGDYITIEMDGVQHVLYGDTAYSFLTYYPLPELFFGVLESVLTFVKRQRKHKYLQNQSLSDADFGLVLNIMRNEGKAYLDSLFVGNIPRPLSTIKYNYYDPESNSSVTSVEFICPPKNLGWVEAASWNCGEVFDLFGLDDIIYLVSAVLLDKSVVFVSENFRLLTSAINTILGLIHPFKHATTLAVNIGTASLNVLDSPFPLIGGLNKSERYFWNQKLYENSTCMFVFLDSSKIYTEKLGKDSDFPLMSFVKNDVQEAYKEAGQLGSNFQIIDNLSTLQNDFETRKQNILKSVTGSEPSIIIKSGNPKKLEKEIAKAIFVKFRDVISKKLVPIVDKLTELKLQSIPPEKAQPLINQVVSKKDVREFLYAYIASMNFHNHPDFIFRLSEDK